MIAPAPRTAAQDVPIAVLMARVAQAHDLESPAVEDAFAHLAIDHPDAVAASVTRPEVAS